MLSTLTSYRLVVRDIEKSTASATADRSSVRETAYFLSKIGSIKTIDQFIGDRRVFNFAMKALGLGDMTNARALMRKVLEGGTDANDSLANKLSDPRFREFANVFDFKRFGSATTSFESAQKGVVDRYARQMLEESAGRDNEGVRLALYFERKAPQISSVYQFLADPALFKVVQTAFNLPSATTSSALDKQADLLSRKIPIADLKSPAKVAKLLERFAVFWDMNQRTASPPTTIAPLQQASAVVSAESLAAIQNLKRGG